MKDIYQKYEELFQIYLRICKKKDCSLESDIKDYCEKCNMFAEQLSGMVYLMKYSGCITYEEKHAEMRKITSEFSTVRLYSAYIRNGEVYVFAEKSTECMENTALVKGATPAEPQWGIS